MNPPDEKPASDNLTRREFSERTAGPALAAVVSPSLWTAAEIASNGASLSAPSTGYEVKST